MNLPKAITNAVLASVFLISATFAVSDMIDALRPERETWTDATKEGMPESQYVQNGTAGTGRRPESTPTG